MEHTCKALKDMSGRVDSILLFGLVRHVCRRPQNIERARHDLDLYCTARDQYGNTYDILTDYDPCLSVSVTIAIEKEAKP